MVKARIVVCRVKVVAGEAETLRDRGVGGGIWHSSTALTTTAVRASVLAVLSLNAVTRVVESVSFCTQALVTPLGVIADLLTVVRLLRALVDVSTGAEITGEPVASGAGALVAACCVVASRLTVVQTPVLTLVNVQALVSLTYRESEDEVMTWLTL